MDCEPEMELFTAQIYVHKRDKDGKLPIYKIWRIHRNKRSSNVYL